MPPPLTQLNAVASQRTAALAGGELQIEVSLANPGSVAATGIVLNLPVPAGATFSRTQAAASIAGPLQFTTSLSAGWSCTGAVSCTYASLPAGQQTSVVLVFDVSPSATGTLTLTPSISAPAGAVVNSTPVTVSIYQIPGLLVAETRAGTVQGVGNSVVTCNGVGNCAAAQTFTAPNNNHTGYTMQYVNTAGGTFNSSSADLALAGTVAHAFLVWSGDTVAGAATAPNAAGRSTVSFTTPSGTSLVSADQLFDAAGGIYTAYADVTSLVAANGTYSVADIQTAAGVGTFGGWSLVVVVHNSSMPERLLMAVAPLATVSTSSTYSFTFPVPTPMVNTSATWLAVGFEGDYDLLGDSATLAGSTVANPFRSVVPGTRNPATPNTMGTDVCVHTVSGLNGSSMGFTAATSNDQLQLGFLAIALDL
ncbi:MAG TPA: hypothetical protein DCR14_02895 [Acidimicrobiaceae bacterium]|nr:hypothetical protein [Acidimicrobiaceae bacterium]